MGITAGCYYYCIRDEFSIFSGMNEGVYEDAAAQMTQWNYAVASCCRAGKDSGWMGVCVFAGSHNKDISSFDRLSIPSIATWRKLADQLLALPLTLNRHNTRTFLSSLEWTSVLHDSNMLSSVVSSCRCSWRSISGKRAQVVPYLGLYTTVDQQRGNKAISILSLLLQLFFLDNQ